MIKEKPYSCNWKYLITVFLFMFLGPGYAAAQTVLTESFSYPSGKTLVGYNWTQMNAGANAITLVKGNLEFNGAIGSGIGNKIALANNGQDLYRTFPVTSASLYSALVVNVSAANITGDYFFALGTNATPFINVGAKLYIRRNGAGFSFGVLRGNTGTPVYESTVRPFNQNIHVVLKYEVVAGSNNDIVKLFVNPSTGDEPVTADATYNTISGTDGALSAMCLVQGTAGNAPTLEVDNIHLSNDWSTVMNAVYDYGDAPKSYDYTKDGVYAPAVHKPVTGLMLGTLKPDLELLPHSVLADASNNYDKGDGLDEDALDAGAIPKVRKGVAYSLDVPVRNGSTATKYLYGWIDFNNDGKFQLEEMANIEVSFTTTGASIQTLNWNNTKTGMIPTDTRKLYMRLRLSDRSLYDFTTAASGGALIDERSIGSGAFGTSLEIDNAFIAGGEVEDYQIDVVKTFDFGDLPESFEKDKDGNYRPALHAPFTGFTLGSQIDVEDKAASVSPDAENNTQGDNALGLADEDALKKLVSVSPGATYSIAVPVNIPEVLGTNSKYVYGWLDLNGDGKFQVGEVATAGTTGYGALSLTVTWTAAQTAQITAGRETIYLRLRLSNLALNDFITTGSGGDLIDERSVGNGAFSTASAVNNPTIAFGEVEDYQVPIGWYDFGDAPVSYDQNSNGVTVPARHMAHNGVRIGKLVDNEKTPLRVEPQMDNNGDNGDGADEDGLTELPIIIQGAPFSFDIPVETTVAANVIAWIDFNGNGRFEANEAAYTLATGAVTGYQTVATGSSTKTFWFRGSQTNMIPDGMDQVYVRIRLAQVAGADNAATNDVDERAIGDGLNTGVYNVPYYGEVEDYRFSVIRDLDYGDAPASYNMDKDGTDPVINLKPARNLPNDKLQLGRRFTVEENPLSVAMGADNNNPNGDGISDDGLQNEQLFLNASAINNFSVAVTNTTGAAATLYAWIDVNNNGRFEASEFSSVSVPTDADLVTLSFTAAQAKAIAATTNKVYMRLRLVQPNVEVAIGDLTTGTNALVVDERAIADGLPSGVFTSVSAGEVEDYQLTVIRDFGDLPVSYEYGSPAFHTNTFVPQLTIGKEIDFELANTPVNAGADNNGLNGDGVDEDGLALIPTVYSGLQFSLKVPVTSQTAGTKHLYGWIDFNGDGIFNGNEAAYIQTAAVANATTDFTLTWVAAATALLAPEVIDAGKVYARLRLSDVALPANSNNLFPSLIDSRSYGAGNNTLGEVEDYQFLVTTNLYDFGDAPMNFDRNKDGEVVAARQTISTALRLGKTIDIEENQAYVMDGADNNGLLGDGADEDGIEELVPVYRGSDYYANVNVFNKTGAARTLYGWIDFNNNKRFEASEVAIFSVPSADTQQRVTLKWTAGSGTTNAIPIDAENLYMRLRISEGTLTDLTSGANAAVVDERAIADGFSTGVYGAIQPGEIEDYRVNVGWMYDYGDLANSYEINRDGATVPAQHIPSVGLFIGDSYPDGEGKKQVEEGTANGDNITGIDDEGGMEILPILAGGGAGYSLSVKVTNKTGGAKILYAWIDFNGNGRFEAGEFAWTSVPANATLVALSWTAAQAKIVGTPSQLALRLRLSNTALADYTTAPTGALVDERAIGDGLSTGLYGTTVIGEVEDHFIAVTNNLDYGDAPISYDQPGGTFLPARHALSPTLRMGLSVDDEPSAQNVIKGSDNNGLNGDGIDEDGINPADHIIQASTDFVLPVKVTNTTGAIKNLYGWIDFNRNGVFDIGEVKGFAVPTGMVNGIIDLTWPAAVTGALDRSDNVYLRLRLSGLVLSDNTATTYDERAYADGLTTGAYGLAPSIGEIEDYSLSVNCTGLKVFNKNGGLTATDGLKIQMSGAGNLQIYRENRQQIYASSLDATLGLYNHPGTQHGLALSIGNSTYSTATLVASGKTFGGNPLVLSNTCRDEMGPDGGTQKNTIRMKVPHNGLDYFLNVTYTYTAPEWLMGVTYEVEIPEGNRETVKLAHGWDTYLSGGDTGPGFVQGKAPYYTMGVVKTDAFEAFRYKSGVPWSGYYSGKYLDLSTNLGSNATFTKHINPDATTDNGIGISIDFGKVPGTYSSINELIFRCDAPTSAPTLSPRTVNIDCGKYTADLTKLFTGTLPKNVVLRWFDKTTGEEINPLEAPVGTYEVEYLDTVNNCTSPRTTATVIKTTPDIQEITPLSQVVCLFGDVSSLVPTVTGGELTYQWYANTTKSNEGGVAIAGATQLIFTPSSNVRGTFYYYLGLSNTYCTTFSEVVTVIVDAPTITGEAEVGVGRKTQLTGSGNPADVTPWVSSDPTIATISDHGLVTGHKYGEITITYTNAEGCSSTFDMVVGSAPCYLPGIVTGTALGSYVGYTTLGRAGAIDGDNWPMVRTGAWLVLESKTKGFVLNRLPFDDDGNPIGIPEAHFVEGMMVYDTTNNCLKVYTSADAGVTYKWFEMGVQGCPE